jgi:transposase
MFGPRLQAFVALLTGVYRLSRRQAGQLLSDACGVQISLGTVVALEQSMSAALQEPVEEARSILRSESAANVDETGWRRNGVKHWLWVAVSASVTVFLIRGRRSTAVCKELLGELYRGYVTSDRYSAYEWIERGRRQICWAHLQRDFERMAEAQDECAAALGRQLLEITQELFHFWHRVRDGTLKRSSFRVYVSGLKRRMRPLFDQGVTCEHRKASAVCTDLLRLWPAMWTFVRVEGLEPTNNAAERALRPAVIWRRTSFGTYSEAGAEYVERMLTAVATLRRYDRNVLEYLTATIMASHHHRMAPSLIAQPPLSAETLRLAA